MLPRHLVAGPDRRPSLRKAVRVGIAIAICLTAPDAAAGPARLAVAGVVQLAPSIVGALRTVSGLVAMTSQQSNGVAARMTDIIGFRG